MNHFMKISTPLCRIPQIDDGFIPQGVAYDPAEDKYLITGYMLGFGSSPIYVIDPRDGSEKKILMQTEGKKAFRGHAGGISVWQDKAYVAGSTAGCMYGFSLRRLYDAADGSEVSADVKVRLAGADDRIRVSFTASDEELLYAGEFHRDPVFSTCASHTVEVRGRKQKAYLFGFRPDAGGSAEPVCVYSIPDQIQGACFGRGHVFLSMSHGFKPSKVLAYDLSKVKAEETRTVLGKPVPLYVLTERGASAVRRLPPMIEEMTMAGGRLVTVFEAASDLYRIGKRMGLDRVLSAPAAFFCGVRTADANIEPPGDA